MAGQQFPTISAGALIFGPGNTVFLMRSHKWRDKYQIPGGKIELGESIEDALRREVREETGLDSMTLSFFAFKSRSLMMLST